MSKTYNDIPISVALRNLTSSKRWSVTNDYDTKTIQWQDTEAVCPSLEQINTEREKIASDFNKIEYRTHRKNGEYELKPAPDGGMKWEKIGDGYPPIQEQLDYIYHYGVDSWKTDIIDPVKLKYPKPSETE